MTIVRDIQISNFRGIRALRWMPNPGVNCLIGPGDGGKSTVLDAIEVVVGLKRNLGFTDADFHKCDVSVPIVIDVTLGDLDDNLLNLENYGHFLRGLDGATGTLSNETSADLETVLTVRLTVRNDLEPNWTLFSDGVAAAGREKNLHWKDRQAIAPTRLGVVASHHMALGPRSVLGKLSQDRTEAAAALAAATREARQAFAAQGCDGVNNVLAQSESIATDLGVPARGLQALLDVRGGTFSGGAIALHDGDHVPLRSLGAGSMRLLVAGLQNAVGNSSISIIDEVEFGLEPYRILRLLDALGAKGAGGNNQVFMTTHSPIVLRELMSSQLHVVRKSFVNPALEQIVNTVMPLGNDVARQKTLRACAEAFLAPSVIVCEGKTEIGLIRGLDLYNQNLGHRSILAHGCHWADGGGSTMIERAMAFASLGYRTALFMDSDVEYSQDKYDALDALNVTVIRWPAPLSTEAALFAAAPAAAIGALLQIACDWKSDDSINAKIRNESDNTYNLESCRDHFIEEMRTCLGTCAGRAGWFKDIEPAERLMREVIAPQWANTGLQFQQPVNALWNWVLTSPTLQPERAAPQPDAGA